VPAAVASSSIFLALVGAVMAICGYAINKALERRHELLMLRRRKYPEYMLRLETLLRERDDDSWFKYRDALVELYLLASPEVVRVVAELHAQMQKPIEIQDESRRQHLLAQVFVAMRADCFDRTFLDALRSGWPRRADELRVEEIRRLLPEYEWSKLRLASLPPAAMEAATDLPAALSELDTSVEHDRTARPGDEAG
jgi:hypothetical protein